METVPEQIIFDRFNFTDEFKDHVVYEIYMKEKTKKQP